MRNESGYLDTSGHNQKSSRGSVTSHIQLIDVITLKLLAKKNGELFLGLPVWKFGTVVFESIDRIFGQI